MKKITVVFMGCLVSIGMWIGSLVPGVAMAALTGFDGIKIRPEAYQTYSMQVQDSNGNNKLTVTRAGLTAATQIAVATLGVTGAATLASTLSIGDDVTLENSEVVSNGTNGTVSITGAGGTADTDVAIDLDGADGPSFSVATSGDYFTFAERTDFTGAVNVTGAVGLSSTLSIGDDVTLENAEVVSNGTDGTIAITGAGGSDDTDVLFDLDGTHPVVSSTDGEVEYSGTLTADVLTAGGAFTASSTSTLSGDVTLESSESISNSSDDYIVFSGVGGSDNTDIQIDLDGTRPIISSPEDGNIEIADTLTVNTLSCTGCATSTVIADNVRSIPIPLAAWRVGRTALLGSGTTPNLGTEGSYTTIEYGTGETTQILYTDFQVPQDFVSGLELHIMIAYDGAVANVTDTLNFSWYSSADHEADDPSAVDECGTPCAISDAAETVEETVIALDGGSPAVGDMVEAALSFAAIDQTIHIVNTWLEYTAEQ